MKSMQEIKMEFQNAAEEEIPELCRKYRSDSRKGVQSILTQAEKRMENSNCLPACSADVRFCIQKTPPALFLCRGCFYMRAYLEEV